MERRPVRHESAAPHQGKQLCTVGGLAGRRSPGCSRPYQPRNPRPRQSLSPQHAVLGLPLTHNAELPYIPGHRKRVLITSPQVTDVHILVPSGMIGGSQKRRLRV